MKEPSLAVQTAIFGLLTRVLKSTKIYDRVPDTAATPYIQVGDDQVIPDKADCFERSCEVISTIHVYTYDGQGRAGAKAIAGQVVDALENAELGVDPDYAHLLTLHEGTRYLDEPDGRTVHAVLTFKTLLDAAGAA